MNDHDGPHGLAGGQDERTMGELITVDFRAGKVISRERYWLGANALHRQALQGWTGRTGEI